MEKYRISKVYMTVLDKENQIYIYIYINIYIPKIIMESDMPHTLFCFVFKFFFFLLVDPFSKQNKSVPNFSSMSWVMSWVEWTLPLLIFCKFHHIHVGLNYVLLM